MIERPRLFAPLFAGLALAACGAPLPEGTGGTDVDPGPFGRGIYSLNTSDAYDATTVSLVGLDGAVLSGSFIAAGLPGDVIAPSQPVPGDDVVLLDRWYSLVTWVDVRTAKIRAQFHADGDELARNPWDYMAVAPGRAYVTRYDPWPGNAQHGDIAIVSPETADVLAGVEERIDIAPALGLADGYVVHPARGVVVGDRAYVVTVNATPEYEYTYSHVVVIDTARDEVIEARELSGLHDCTAIAASPGGDELAIACSGDLQANGELRQGHSGLVVLSRGTLEEKRRFGAAELGGGVLGFSLSYVSDGEILFLMPGNVLAGIRDSARVVHMATGETREIHAAPPFTIGEVRCPGRMDGGGGEDAAPGACFVTDAGAGVLLRYPVQGGGLGEGRAIRVDGVVGLPPRYLGQF